MEFPREKFGEVFHAVENLGGGVLAWLHGLLSSEKIEALRLAAESSAAGALAWFDEVFPPETRTEKIKALRLAAESSAAGALAWFDKVFPPETRAEQIDQWLRISKPYLIAGGALAVLVILRRWCGGGGGLGKMMKAPGRSYRMPRADFECDPRGYFRDFRAGK